DSSGVSGHPNHRSLFHGSSHLLSRPTTPSTVRAYALISVPLSIKYLSLIAPLQAKSDLYMVRAFKQLGVPVPVFVAGVHQWWTIFRALIAHRSQLVWFRWLYIVFSRYLWVNEWIE